jgi:hypothetical protein
VVSLSHTDWTRTSVLLPCEGPTMSAAIAAAWCNLHVALQHPQCAVTLREIITLLPQAPMPCVARGSCSEEYPTLQHLVAGPPGERRCRPVRRMALGGSRMLADWVWHMMAPPREAPPLRKSMLM